jgi:hypothetical protein
MKDKSIFERVYAICLKASGAAIGAITVDTLEYLYELEMRWMMNSFYTGKGCASVDSEAASDYLLETFSPDYISFVMDMDDSASFTTAQKSGFGLFEKRYPYDYSYSGCDVENFDEVGKHFKEIQSRG